MDLDILKQRAVAVPFLNFIVVLTDGRRFLISRRNQLAVSPLGTYFVIEDYERRHRLDVSLIHHVEEAEIAPAH